MSKNRHDMLTAQVPNELQYRTCSQLQVYPLSVSDCLSVCLCCKYVLHTGAMYSVVCVCSFVCLCCLYCFIVCFVF